MQLDILYDDFIREKRSYCTEKSIVFYEDNVKAFLEWCPGYLVFVLLLYLKLLKILVL